MTKKSPPKKVKFFVADDIRAEASMKPMIFGLYPDDVVRALMQAGQPQPTQEVPIVIQSLAILAVFIDCKGTFEAEIALYQPNGKALIEPKKLEEGLSTSKLTAVGEKTNISFIANFMPFTIPEFGKYRFVIKLDETEYTHEFEINGAFQQ